MRTKPFKQDSTTAHPSPVSNEFVREALARQAAIRPAPTPPRSMPVTPTLPKRRRGGRRPPRM
jgi:hypothetical protein